MCYVRITTKQPNYKILMAFSQHRQYASTRVQTELPEKVELFQDARIVDVAELWQVMEVMT